LHVDGAGSQPVDDCLKLLDAGSDAAPIGVLDFATFH
jgi:hypothetical protein